MFPLHAIKVYGGVEVQLHSFVTSAKERTSSRSHLLLPYRHGMSPVFNRSQFKPTYPTHTEPDLAAHCVKRPRTHQRRLPVQLNRLSRKGNTTAFQSLVKFPFLYKGSLKIMYIL